MLFLMMFIKKIKGEPKQGYARIYNTRSYPMGIRSVIMIKQAPITKHPMTKQF